MKTIVMQLVAFLLLATPFANAMNAVEGPARCKQCGMDRTAFAQSRMLIVYADETVVGVCSIRCAAVEIQQNKDRQLSSFKVADYATSELIDARSATWVIGGAKKGVMTATAKWAFARTEDARSFVENSGGDVASFDQAMQAATEEVLKATQEEKAVEREILLEQQ